MVINIDQLSEAELIDLDNRIVARLRFLQQMRAHVEMLEFKIGDRVTFQPPGHGSVDWLLCGSRCSGSGTIAAPLPSCQAASNSSAGPKNS
jgi:hypothetical protein